MAGKRPARTSVIRDDHEAYWSGYLDDLRDLLEDAAGS